MPADEQIFSFLNQGMVGLVFLKKISWQTEDLFASHLLIEFRISPFVRGNGETKDFYVNYFFSGFCPHDVSRDAYRWYIMIFNIQPLYSDEFLYIFLSISPSVRPSRTK